MRAASTAIATCLDLLTSTRRWLPRPNILSTRTASSTYVLDVCLSTKTASTTCFHGPDQSRSINREKYMVHLSTNHKAAFIYCCTHICWFSTFYIQTVCSRTNQLVCNYQQMLLFVDLSVTSGWPLYDLDLETLIAWKAPRSADTCLMLKVTAAKIMITYATRLFLLNTRHEAISPKHTPRGYFS